MRRIEALKLIANQLDFLNSKFKGVRDDFSAKELSCADVILTTLEQAGMLPPIEEGRRVEDLDLGAPEWE